MKKIKRIVHSIEPEHETVPWLNPMICYDIEVPVTIAPYPQPNTYTTKLSGYIEPGSNISQQFRFVFFNQDGTTRNSTWSLLTTNSIRLDSVDTNISLIDFYDEYLENDIQVQFQNTAGSVYMNSYWLTDSSSGPSSMLQSYCASFLTGPLDAAASMRSGPYNANRPSGYVAWQGITTQMSIIPAIQESAIDFRITFTNIYFSTYPAATWQYQIYKSNSQTSQTLVNSGNLVLNQSTGILSTYLYKNICNSQYTLKLLCFNSGTQVLSPFVDIPLTTYMGLAFQASRISGVWGNAPIQTTVPSALATVSWGIRANYTSPYLSIPTDDHDPDTYVQLRIVTTMLNQVRPSVIKGLTIWYNFDGTSGYWPLCINQPLSNGTQFQLRTGGQTQASVAFSVPYLRTLVSSAKPLHFDISSFALNEGAYCNEEFTAGRFSTSLSGLVDLAQASPNQWVTNSTYQITAQPIRNGNSSVTSILSFQIQAQYTQNVQPTIIPQGGEQQIKEKAVDDAERIVETISRVEWKEVTDPHTQFMLETSYMNDQLPTFKQRAAQFTYNNPTQMEHMELAKEQIHQFIKKEGGDSWLDAPVQDFFGLLLGLDSAAARVKYPQLFKRDANKAFVAQNLLKEHYPHASSVLDFYQPLQSLPRAPFYKGMNQNDKTVTQAVLDSIYHKSIMGTGVGSEIRKIQHDIEIDIRANKDPALVASFGGFTPSELNLLYYNFGLKYNPQNETQGQMLESLKNPKNVDMYIPENKLFGDVPTYSLLAQNWIDSQLNLETFAIVMANYIATKRSFNAESVKGLDKGSMSEVFSGLVKDTLYNFNPLGVEAKFITSAMLKTAGQKAIYNTIKDYVKTYGSFDNLVSIFSKMKKVTPYQDLRSRDMERPSFWLGLPSVVDYYTTDSQKLEKEKRKTSKYPLESRTYLYDHLGTGNTKIDPKEMEIVRKFENDNPNWTYSQLQDLKKQLYLRKFGKLTRAYKAYFPSIHLMDQITLDNIKKTAIFTKNALEKTRDFIQPHAKNAMEVYLPYLNEKGGDFLQYLKEEGEKKDRKKFLPWYKFGFGTPDYRLADKIRMQAAEDARKGIVRSPDDIQWGAPEFFKYLRFKRADWANDRRERDIMEANYPKEQKEREIMLIRSENERILKQMKERRLKRDAQKERDRLGLDYPQAVKEPWRFRLPSLPQMPTLPSDGQMGQYFMDVELQKAKDQKEYEQYIRDRGRSFVRPAFTPIGDFLNNPLQFIVPKKREAKKKAKAQEKPQQPKADRNWYDTGKTTAKILGGLGTLYFGYKGAQTAYDYMYPSPPSVNNSTLNSTSNSTLNSSLQSNDTIESTQEPFTVIDDIAMEESVQQDDSVYQNVNPQTAPLTPQEFFADEQNDVRVQQMREDIAANQITAEVIIATAESQLDIQALLDDDKSDNGAERYQNIHAVGKLLTALDRKVKGSVQIQHFLKIGLGNMFERQYKRQYMRGNQEGFMHFKMLKAIINPKTPDEFQLQKLFYNYFLSKPLYDAQDVLSKKYGEPLLDGLKELMLSPGPVFDFIERVAHKSGIHKTSFNGSMYAESSRPVYNIPERMSVRPILNDISIMPLKRLKNIKF